jgi:hypothetical protein
MEKPMVRFPQYESRYVTVVPDLLSVHQNLKQKISTIEKTERKMTGKQNGESSHERDG